MNTEPEEESKRRRRNIRRSPTPPSPQDEHEKEEPPHPIFKKLRKLARGNFPGPQDSRMAQYLEKIVTKLKTDSLTGLPTYQLFTDKLLEVTDERLKQTQQGFLPSPCTVVHCDINHFKIINDTIGQDAADQLLVWFAGMLKKGLRQNRPGRTPDFIVRRSGDEFLILMPNATEAEAQKRLEEIAEQLPGKRFVVERADRNNQYFTVSNISTAFGCYQLDPGLQAGDTSFDTPKTAIAIAEGYMKQHKDALKMTRSTQPHIAQIMGNAHSLMHDPAYINLIDSGRGRGR